VDEKANFGREIIGRVMLRGLLIGRDSCGVILLRFRYYGRKPAEEVLVGVMSLSGKGEDVLMDDEFLFGLADLENANLESRYRLK
jgi:hypothetical protein